ncbi:unnamed protein product [Fusarium venenatum]|uniref:Uncharacterized protein n=1 Tax=Fusarium venenatum TaxID=56646 RepID=A0A2L2U1Z2_9HYPO|nr:uncharacterized protein FVRRES_08342 [Fusarium venenatum]CEI68265.1 unnamed protein product [Fusarium venenatum]
MWTKLVQAFLQLQLSIHRQALLALGSGAKIPASDAADGNGRTAEEFMPPPGSALKGGSWQLETSIMLSTS